jgi:hypothetical protein
MLNRLTAFAKQAIFTVLLAAGVSTVSATPASSQVLPEFWGTIGSVDDLVSYGVGARFLSTGLEIGTGEEGATGADVLTFIGLPVVSVAPYVGVGFYSGDETIAYSGGVHFGVSGIMVGAGYHSVRGFNGKLGFQF